MPYAFNSINIVVYYILNPINCHGAGPHAATNARRWRLQAVDYQRQGVRGVSEYRAVLDIVV